MKEYDKAIADYTEAIRLDPKRPTPTSTGATPGIRRRSTTRPSPTTPRRSGSIPKDAMAYNNRGVAWHAKKEYDKAIADYTEAIRLDPKDARGLQQPRARLARKEGVRQGDRRLHRGDPARPQGRRRLQQPRRSPGTASRSTTRPSPTTPRPSGSTPRTPRPTTTAATPGTPRRSTTRPSPTSPRRSGSIPRTPRRFAVAATPGAGKREHDKAIADATRRSGSTRAMAGHITAAHWR